MNPNVSVSPVSPDVPSSAPAVDPRKLAVRSSYFLPRRMRSAYARANSLYYRAEARVFPPVPVEPIREAA